MENLNFEDLLEQVKKQPEKRLVVVNGVDVNTLEALNKAVEMGLVKAILTGDRERIEETCSNLDIDINNYEIVHTLSEREAAEKAVGLIHDGKADLIMKGLVSTDKFMKVLLKKEYGLVPPRGILSHVALMENPNYHKLLVFSDAGVIPYPDLQQKITMTRYLIQTAQSLGIEKPKVAVIAPTEQIIISIQSCMDGATIAKMSEHGQIEGGEVDGPMALDVAINRNSASIKGFTSSVAGDADCLLFPNIDAANVFYKTNSKLCKAQMAGIIAGAKVPAVVVSRGDSERIKFNSIAMASLIS
ncbi:phosphate butyryltransferase [Tangfeifania diversioriginum]|uniref:Phosphate butyryltransferase n=1 Tax=Tangfeifania diversioriginum TaxID=1168035 RepID=A0A1M6FSV5_9BACT|nr:phosphate acyltransferase [Tangfeifania diversioriginum]SHJ00808.1 phosphate butyryltransferase [Tangfeifania diversioriginum]